jgi:hypothetical protein
MSLIIYEKNRQLTDKIGNKLDLIFRRNAILNDIAVSSAMQYILIPLNQEQFGGLSLSPPWEGGLGGI